jgi:hypothetical protein
LRKSRPLVTDSNRSAIRPEAQPRSLEVKKVEKPRSFREKVKERQQVQPVERRAPAPAERGKMREAPAERGKPQEAPAERGKLREAPAERGKPQEAPAERGKLREAPAERGKLREAQAEGKPQEAPAEKEAKEAPAEKKGKPKERRRIIPGWKPPGGQGQDTERNRR